MIFSQRAHLAIEKNLRFFHQPQKQKHCNQGKNIFDFDPCLSLVDTRFVLLFLEFTKKILASVYERLNESSIIPPLENRF